MDSRILSRASQLCRDEFGADCRLEPREELVAADWGRSIVWRCALHSAAGPQTLILKQSNLGGGHGSNEAAALRCIDHAALPAVRFPALLAADTGLGLLLLGDLGRIEHNRLADWRDRLPRADHLALLKQLMHALGSFNRLHPISSPRLAALAAGGLPPDRTEHAAMRFEQLLAALPAAFASQAIPLGPDAIRELDQHASLLARRSSYCLTHADICPGNVAWHAGQLAIYDFEVAGLRHPAVDAAWPRMRALRCFHCTRLDEPEIAALEAAWLDGFCGPPGTASCVDASALFSAGSLLWLAAMLEWLPGLLVEDHARDRVPDRQRLLASLRALQACQLVHGGLPALCAACRELELRLVEYWPESL